MNTELQPNFLGKTRRSPRLLQFATLLSVGGAGVMVALFLWGPSSLTGQTADIGAAVSSFGATATSSAQAAHAVPKMVSTSGINSVAAGVVPDTVRYYEAATGKAFSFDARTGATAVLSDARLAGFMQSWWAPHANVVVSAFTQKGIIQYRSYNYDSHATATVGSTITALTVSPDGLHVAYVDSSSTTPGVWVADIDGTNAHILLESRAQNTAIDWLPTGNILFSSQQSGSDGRDLALIGPGGNLRVLMTNKTNLEYVWSHDGTKLLFSYYIAQQGVTLGIFDIADGTQFSLNVPTSANKCAWLADGTAIVCGVPHNTELSETTSAAHTATNDDIVSVDTSSGVQTTLYRAVASMPAGAINPIVTSSDSTFVFTNLFDKKLYAFPL